MTPAIFDFDGPAGELYQHGHFFDRDGNRIRCNDDIEFLRDAVTDNDPSGRPVPAGTTDTVLMFSWGDEGVAQIEVDCRDPQPAPIDIAYESLRFLKLHMTNEEKYPR